jgi:peptidoglycan hydrolase-like protein with peptidoglycan-binding domain
MLCTRFFVSARGMAAVVATLLVASLALPSGASANDHGRSVPTHTAASIMRFGDGYSQPAGSQRVRRVQQRLRVLGYATGPVDGRYGPLTEGAVTRFQADRGLQVDGEVGPSTSARLRRTTTIVRYGSGYALPHGSQRVRALQRRLRALGYQAGPVDGRFGPMTWHAVTAFQARHGLAPDGAVGPRALALLRPRAVTPRPIATGDRRWLRPKAIPALDRPAPPERVSVPAPPPAAALILAIALLGLAVCAASYLRTHRGLAQARRDRPPTALSKRDPEGVR